MSTHPIPNTVTENFEHFLPVEDQLKIAKTEIEGLYQKVKDLNLLVDRERNTIADLDRRMRAINNIAEAIKELAE